MKKFGNFFAFCTSVLVLPLFLFFSCASAPVEEEKSVHELIAEGRYEEAKALFDAKIDINSADENGNTSLHLAAAANEDELISFLIARGADTELVNNDGDTPLLVAIKKGSLDAAKVLAIVKGNIFAKDRDEKSALSLALARGDAWYDAMITIQSGALRDADGETIVHYFVRISDEKAIATCIRKGLPLSQKNNSGKTPLHLCFEDYNSDVSVRIAAELLMAGADCVRGDFAYFEDAVRTRNMMLRFADGQTPLHIASILGHKGIVSYILMTQKTARTVDILQAQDISGATPLHEAVRYGQVETAEILLDNGAKVDALDSIGKSPFLLIIPKEKQYDMYKLLLENNADVTQKDMFGDTVLHIVTMSDVPVKVLELLLANGAPVNERNKQGVTPLSLAIEHGFMDHVVFYSENGADINAEDMKGNTPLSYALASPSTEILASMINSKNILAKDSSGNTALHTAILNDSSFEHIKFLIDHGADVNARNKNGDSVLYLAVIKNKKDAGDLLLSKGADIFATNTENNSPLRIALTHGGDVQDWLITSHTLNMTDGSGNTPLHYASEWQLDNAVISLIQKGAKINEVNSNGETALFSAVKADSPSIINILVENGIVTDARSNLARDYQGNTPLHAAVRWNALGAADSIISLGFDVNAQNLSGKTALSDACRAEKKEMAEFLIKNGANVNAVDATGKTILVDSIQTLNKEIIVLLLNSGANPHIQDMSGRNSYHEAALTGNIEIISLIRNAGANPLSRDSYGDSPFSLVLNFDEDLIKAVLGNNINAVDSDGNSPVHIAVEKNVTPAKLTMLVNMGFPVNQRNGKGMTPLNLAISNGQKSLALVLLERGADPFIATINGDSPLTNAFKTGNVEILDAIVKYNAGKTDMQGDSILHYAARIANEVQVSHLLTLGLDRNARNFSGETPYQMANRWNRSSVAELLK